MITINLCSAKVLKALLKNDCEYYNINGKYNKHCNVIISNNYCICNLQICVSSVLGDFYNPICTSFGFSCLDCYTQKFCFGSGTPTFNSSCNSGNPQSLYKFCNPDLNQCAAVPHQDCEASNSKCPRPNGVFPDLQDCTRYLKCENNIMQTLHCTSRQIYSQSFGKCILKLQPSDCKKISCVGISGKFPHPEDNSLYYECNSLQPELHACPKLEIYNSFTKKCENICKNVGTLADTRNCSQFTSCEGDTSLVAYQQSCSLGYGFSTATGRCEKGLNQLCLEISLIDQDLSNLLPFPELFRIIIIRIRTVLASLGIDYSILWKLGMPIEWLSNSFLIIDYFLTHSFTPPPSILKDILDIVILWLPPHIGLPIKLGMLPLLETIYDH